LGRKFDYFAHFFFTIYQYGSSVTFILCFRRYEPIVLFSLLNVEFNESEFATAQYAFLDVHEVGRGTDMKRDKERENNKEAVRDGI
jgi:hypothetical protein